jgi:arylsulfatase A-like enzyme
MVDFIDDAVGRILAALEESGQADDTIVVFTSDHGDWLGDHQLWQKGAIHFQGVTRVPWIVRWPDVAQPRRRIESVASQIDMMPTLLDAAGVEIPYAVQGESLRPVLAGEQESVRPYALVEHRHEAVREDSYFAQNHPEAIPGGVMNWGDEDVHVKTIITDDHRLSHVTGIPEDYGELFDLTNDPHETENLWKQCPDLRREMQVRLLEALIEAEDPLEERKHAV